MEWPIFTQTGKIGTGKNTKSFQPDKFVSSFQKWAGNFFYILNLQFWTILLCYKTDFLSLSLNYTYPKPENLWELKILQHNYPPISQEISDFVIKAKKKERRIKVDSRPLSNLDKKFLLL